MTSQAWPSLCFMTSSKSLPLSGADLNISDFPRTIQVAEKNQFQASLKLSGNLKSQAEPCIVFLRIHVAFVSESGLPPFSGDENQEVHLCSQLHTLPTFPSRAGRVWQHCRKGPPTQTLGPKYDTSNSYLMEKKRLVGGFMTSLHSLQF